MDVDEGHLLFEANKDGAMETKCSFVPMLTNFRLVLVKDKYNLTQGYSEIRKEVDSRYCLR